MSRMLRITSVACAVGAAAAGVFSVVVAVTRPSLIMAGIAVWDFALVVYNLHNYRKEVQYGRDRKPEEGAQDPGADRGAVTITAGTFTVSDTSTAARLTQQQLERLSAPPPVSLEVVESDLPILAHRSARLLFNGSKRCFGSVTQEMLFGVDADAVCASRRAFYAYDMAPHRHDAPGVDCGCGFYALPGDLGPTYEHQSYVTLMVELSGTVIEHDKGYRAGHQRVVECQIPPCPFCGAQAARVLATGGTMTMAVCDAHAPVLSDGEVLVAVADVAAVVPVPMTCAGRKEVSA